MWMGYLPIRNNSGVIILEGPSGKRAVKIGKAGSPDIIACSPGGYFVAIECKSQKGKTTELQKEFLEKVTSLGGLALVVRSVDELVRGLEVIRQRNHNLLHQKL